MISVLYLLVIFLPSEISYLLSYATRCAIGCTNSNITGLRQYPHFLNYGMKVIMHPFPLGVVTKVFVLRAIVPFTMCIVYSLGATSVNYIHGPNVSCANNIIFAHKISHAQIVLFAHDTTGR